jgi:hypothetical protein
MVNLDAWIEELRGRLERGELRRFGVVELRDGSHTFTLEQAVRIMLADWDHLAALPPASYPDALTAGRRQALSDDFQYLRDRLAS